MFWMQEKQMLGLAIASGAIHLAQVQLDHGHVRLRHAAVFPLSDDASWDRPEDLGNKLKTFLKQNHFTARKAVVGLAGKSILTHECSLPPVSSNAAKGMIRLMIEREYQAPSREWVMDFLGDASSSESRKIQVFATNQARMALVISALKFAGVEVDVVTSSTAALAMLTDSTSVLHVTENETTLAVKRDAKLVALAPLSWDRKRPQSLAAEIRRVLSVAQTKAEQDRPSPTSSLTCWSFLGAGELALDSLIHAISLPPLINPSLESIGVTDARSDDESGTTFDPAAVALAAIVYKRPQQAIVDFQHTRLNAAQDQTFSRKRFAVISAGLALFCAAVYIASIWYAQMSTVEDLKSQLASCKGDVVDARANLERYALVRGWFDTRPALLDELRSISQTFPVSSSVWATHFSIREDLTGTLTGKAETEKNALELYEAMRASKEFTQVKLLYLRQAERTSRSVSFAMTFAYKGRE